MPLASTHTGDAGRRGAAARLPGPLDQDVIVFGGFLVFASAGPCAFDLRGSRRYTHVLAADETR
jgi:hypothetical protein